MIKDDASLKLDRDIYDKKNQELSEQLKKLQAEQLQLVELSKNQESIKTRIKEFRKIGRINPIAKPYGAPQIIPHKNTGKCIGSRMDIWTGRKKEHAGCLSSASSCYGLRKSCLGNGRNLASWHWRKWIYMADVPCRSTCECNSGNPSSTCVDSCNHGGCRT